MWRKSILWLGGLALCVSATSYAGELKTQQDKESYSMGLSLGNYLSNELYQQQQLGAKADVALVIEGFVDALKNQGKLTDDETVNLLNQRAETLNQARATQRKQVAENNRTAAAAFFEKNAKVAGVTTLKSGLQYQMQQQGTGDAPKPEDVVTAKYRGTLLDGTEFENSGEQPVRFALMTMIPGLEEGIRQLHTGGKARFFIPADLAYGADGVGAVPPQAALIFDVELVKVEKPAKSHGGMMPGM
ncbi:FKBP-type peptidyl-prolyl cis-trans isomerase [Shewanella fodinae]|uniref:FKBP-type peptidyl-prolyl cis-trans isomerase n=1 Tax=Shewanella fodinae TaxID=552357 RepID=UPI00167A4C1F|nr:FKBP-type peptidyl-prolyl cis-trans isomerase [Shewanella fodinae]MCL2906464.1 FKBP-type peptidyl-prolyl cis-trans isomerase [Shewanella fodinae]GGY93373.1 peptidyl-prolyl cis-trans isomerase [Shewanella fodinae]